MQTKESIPTGLSRKYVFIILLASISISFLLYGNTIQGEFIYDDEFITNRPELRSILYLPRLWTESYLPKNIAVGIYRPVTMVSFSLNYLLFGESPVSFHIVNIILNGIVVFLVYLVVYRLFLRKDLAVTTALVFAVLPIHTEVVASVKSRDELLSMLFLLVGWLAFLKATGTRIQADTKGILGSSLWVLAAAWSKELALVAPVLYLGVFWVQRRKSLKKIVSMALFYVPIIILYFFIRWQVLGENAFSQTSTPFAINPLVTASLLTRLATSFKLTTLAILKTYIPISLSATYHYNHVKLVTNGLSSWEAIAGVILAGILIFLVTSRKLRALPIGIGALIFLVSYIPLSKFFFVSRDLFAERWMYLPSLGLSLVAGDGVLKLYRIRKILSVVFFGILITAYGILTVARNRVWLTRKSLSESMVRDAPDSIQGYLNLASWYFENGERDKAKSEVEVARSIYPDHPPLINLEGTIVAADGDFERAEKLFLETLALDPSFAQAVSNLGRVYYETGRYQLADEALMSTIESQGQYPRPEDVVLYALTLAKIGKYRESLDVLEKYQGILATLRSSLPAYAAAVNYYKLGKLEEARQFYGAVAGNTLEEKERVLEAF